MATCILNKRMKAPNSLNGFDRKEIKSRNERTYLSIVVPSVIAESHRVYVYIEEHVTISRSARRVRDAVSLYNERS